MNSQTIDKMPQGGDELDFLEFVCRYLDDQLTPRELVDLNEQLRTNDAYRETFVRYCLQGKLLAEALVTGIPLAADASPIAEEELPTKTPAESSIPTLTFLGNTIQGTVGYFSSGWPVAYLVATVIFGIGLLIGSLVHVSQPAQVARQSSVPSRVDAEPRDGACWRITGMVDCQWEQGSGARAPGRNSVQIPNPKSPILVSLGDKFALSSGLMEITYDTGAKVILQGPVTYEVESRAGGFLSVGKLTARLEKKAEGGRRAKYPVPIFNPSILSSSNPLFSVRTPTATVTDLGTEFGVEVSREGGTEAHVFVGAIKMAPAGGRSGSEKEQICAPAAPLIRRQERSHHRDGTERAAVRACPVGGNAGEPCRGLRPVGSFFEAGSLLPHGAAKGREGPVRGIRFRTRQTPRRVAPAQRVLPTVVVRPIRRLAAPVWPDGSRVCDRARLSNRQERPAFRLGLGARRRPPTRRQDSGQLARQPTRPIPFGAGLEG